MLNLWKLFLLSVGSLNLIDSVEYAQSRESVVKRFDELKMH